MKLFKKSNINKEEKMLLKLKKKESKKERVYNLKRKMKKRIKNSQSIVNVKQVGEDGLIELKTGEYASILEIQAIDLSLTSSQERVNFYNSLKELYQINDLYLKCYKLDKQINLNSNKDYLNKKIEEEKDDVLRKPLLENTKDLIMTMEEKNQTQSSIYYLIVINKNIELLDKQLDDIENILLNIKPKVNIEFISNRLEIYTILSNLYLTSNTLEQLMLTDLPDLLAPINAKEKTNSLIFDDEEFQMVSIKNIPPYIEDLFFEGAFNLPRVRACINVSNAITQDELINYLNSQYSFALSDRRSTKKLGDATDLDIQTEKYQLLMNDIKSGDEKIKTVSLILVISGNKKVREETFRTLKAIAGFKKIKIDIPRLRQMETWQSYDITSIPLKDYSVYLPTLTIGASFPFTKTYFNDSTGYILGVDKHTDLPIIFDPFVLNKNRTSHNIAVVGTTGSGKSYLLKKLIVDEFARNTKIFVFDAENEYKEVIKANGGEYLNLYSKSGGIINPLQIRYIPSDDEDKKDNDGPLAKHLGFLEMFFQQAFSDMTEKERIMLISVVEDLYNKKGINKKTSIEELQHLSPNDYPIFSEVYEYLPAYKQKVDSVVKKNIIEQLEVSLLRFLTGTDSYLFNGYTTINLNSNLIGFNLQELLGSKNDRLVNTQIMNVLTYLNNNIVTNKIINDTSTISKRKHIMVVADEFHLFCSEKNLEVLKTFNQLARRIRKYSGSLVVATQSIKDFIGNNQVKSDATAIFNNCQYQFVGGLNEDDLNAYIQLFSQNPLTDTQINFLMEAKQGEFLLSVGNKNRLRVEIDATPFVRERMGESHE